MAVHVIKRGLDLPITGAPEQVIDESRSVTRVAVMADDYPLMKPRMHVTAGDAVKRGQVLFEDRKSEGVTFTAPAAGKVVAVNRGARRVLQSVVIELDDAKGGGAQIELPSYSEKATGQALKDLLAESGLWTAFRARPFSRVPSPTETCSAIFVTAIDTHPLSADPAKVIAPRASAFERGLAAIATLTEGKTWLCKAAGAKIPTAEGVTVAEFQGKHPAGLVGTHIHTLEPVNREKIVWHIGYQDVIAIGHLLATGDIDSTRIVALGGPPVQKPRLIKTLAGACIAELHGVSEESLAERTRENARRLFRIPIPAGTAHATATP